MIAGFVVMMYVIQFANGRFCNKYLTSLRMKDKEWSRVTAYQVRAHDLQKYHLNIKSHPSYD